jgi:transposase
LLDPPEVAAILALKAKGWGKKRIARELGIAKGTVLRYLRLGKYEPYKRAPTPGPLWGHDDWLKERFLAVRGNVRVVEREFAERGVVVGYSTLARRLKPLRDELAAQARATLRFETQPGHQMQADFGELFLRVAGVRTKVHLAVLTLGYSRRGFVRAFLAERQEHWLAAMESAFHHFGGVPAEMLIDNPRALVSEHDRATGQVRFTEAFLTFCRFHGTQPRACRPFRARSKGKVESGVKYVKRNALAGKEFDSFAELEAYLEAWTRDVSDVRIHGTTRERPIDRFERERAALRPLKTVAPTPLPLQRKVANDCLVDVDTNRYSVPHAFVGRTVQVLRSDGQLSIRCDGREIAFHAEARGRYQVVAKREHTQGLWPRREVTTATAEVATPALEIYEAIGGAA